MSSITEGSAVGDGEPNNVEWYEESLLLFRYVMIRDATVPLSSNSVDRLKSKLLHFKMADASTSKITDTSSSAKKPRKRFIGSKSTKPSKPGAASSTIANQIPQDILSDTLLNEAIKQLPANYSFEIHKTIHHVRKNNATMVALQMPEGLQMFACTIADIIER